MPVIEENDCIFSIKVTKYINSLESLYDPSRCCVGDEDPAAKRMRNLTLLSIRVTAGAGPPQCINAFFNATIVLNEDMVSLF